MGIQLSPEQGLYRLERIRNWSMAGLFLGMFGGGLPLGTVGTEAVIMSIVMGMVLGLVGAIGALVRNQFTSARTRTALPLNESRPLRSAIFVACVLTSIVFRLYDIVGAIPAAVGLAPGCMVMFPGRARKPD